MVDTIIEAGSRQIVLSLPKVGTLRMDMNHTLSELRLNVDEVDRQLFRLLRDRFVLTDRIGELKNQEKLPMEDKNREDDQRTRMEMFCRETGLDTDICKNIFSTIITNVKARHIKLRIDRD